MKVLMINVDCGSGSTGRICTDIADKLSSQGHTVKIAYGRNCISKYRTTYAIQIGDKLGVYNHVAFARLFDGSGFASKNATKKLIDWIIEYNPDIIHLHNLHGYYIHVGLLFDYLRVCGKKIIWTLHDCWAFTGHCVYCKMDNCEKWKTGCYSCPVSKSEYPISYLDNSRRNWRVKRTLFSGIDNMTIVTPSKWLAKKVENSFLEKYPVLVINNGIDTSVFKPTPGIIRKKYGLTGIVILGVASVWDQRKGLNDFIELRKRLSNNYHIVLIGLNEEQIDKMESMGIIGVERTNSIFELAEWYSTADVFVNPTYEDNYPTTNIEAISCGTPVVTYPTGGSVESAELFGRVCKEKTLDELICAIESVVTNFKNSSENSFDFSKERMIDDYINIYYENNIRSS